MKKTRKIYWINCGLALAVAILILGCQDEGVQPQKAETKVRELSREEQELVRSVNDFAFDLVRQATRQSSSENIFISPLSVNLTMSLMLNGAAESTQQKIYDALDFEVLTPLEINKAYSELIPFLQQLDPQVDYALTNAVWYDYRNEMSPFYRDVLSAYYKAHVLDINFRSKRAPTVIQKWIEEQVQYKLPSSLASIDNGTSLYLTNAVQFTGKWSVPFRKEYTRPAEFYLPNGNSITTDMMYADRAMYRYHRTEQASYIDVPYGNGNYSMTLVMPQTEDSLYRLASTLDAKELQSILHSADTLEQGLYIPKFAINYQTSLKNTLSQLGMGIAFQDSANFANFFTEAYPQPYIGDVLHQAAIEINETGAQAVSVTTNLPLDNNTPSVRIDRSFLFFIREQHSGVILFAGVLANPVI
jgi:serpin B